MIWISGATSSRVTVTGGRQFTLAAVADEADTDRVLPLVERHVAEQNHLFLVGQVDAPDRLVVDEDAHDVLLVVAQVGRCDRGQIDATGTA